MITPLPELYFRLRDGGATVFRIESDAHNGRTEMVQIALVNLETGRVRPYRGTELSQSDMAAIETWIADRRESLQWKRLDHAMRTVEAINQTAHWAQAEASDDDLIAVTDPLLLAMMDLRQLLVKKAAKRARKTP